MGNYYLKKVRESRLKMSPTEPELMIRMLLFTHVPRREKISDLDLKRLTALAKEKLTTSSGDESEFRRWVALMKNKFVSNEWAHLENVK